MNKAQKHKECQNCPYKSLLFQDIDNSTLNILNESKRKSSFQKGEKIIKEGSVINEIVYIKTGLVKLFRERKGEREEKAQIISIAGSYDFVGLLTVFSDNKYNYSITAIEDTEICFVDISFIKKLIKKDGDFAMNIIGKMSKISDEIILSKLDVSYKKLRGRLAYILLCFSQQIYKNNNFTLPVTRQEIGELIDISTESIARTLTEFKRDGIISIDNRKIKILDLKMLQLISYHG